MARQKIQHLGLRFVQMQMYPVRAHVQMMRGESGDPRQRGLDQRYRAPAQRCGVGLDGTGRHRNVLCRGGMAALGAHTFRLLRLLALAAHQPQPAKHRAIIRDQQFQQMPRQRCQHRIGARILPHAPQHVHIQPAATQRIGIHLQRQRCLWPFRPGKGLIREGRPNRAALSRKASSSRTSGSGTARPAAAPRSRRDRRTW